MKSAASIQLDGNRALLYISGPHFMNHASASQCCISGETLSCPARAWSYGMRLWLSSGLIVVGLAFGQGCAALRNDSAATAAFPKPVKTQDALSVAEIVDLHNKNAQAIESFEASPTIAQREGKLVGAATGRMAVERPRNFRLKLKLGVSEGADIGSNDDMFWVWRKDTRDRKIYAAHYDSSGSAGNVLTFQPEWVIEALGLREISPDEEGEITTQKAKDPAFTVLVHKRYDGDGKRYRKLTVVDAKTGKIREHLFYASEDSKSLLARAVTTDYKQVLGADEGSVELPGKIKIEYYAPGQDPIALDVNLGEVHARRFADVDRVQYFTMPKKPGYEVVWMNKSLPEKASTDRPTRSSIRLRDPEKLDPSESTSSRGAAAGGFVSANPTMMRDSEVEPTAVPNDSGSTASADPTQAPAKTRRWSWLRGGN